MKISLIRADNKHKRVLYDWRNIPEIVKLGSSNSKVTWDEHSEWFDELIVDPQRLQLIIFLNGHMAGQVRFTYDSSYKAATISIFILRNYRGLGLGKLIINQSCLYAASYFESLIYITASILNSNLRSLNTFKSVGFVENTIFDSHHNSSTETCFLLKASEIIDT